MKIPDYNKKIKHPTYLEMQEEIERLKDLCNKYEEEHKTTYEIWKKDIYLYNSLVDRIDKALSYLRDIGNWLRDDSSYRAKLIDILQGSDKDERINFR